ncbi:hypothetical protein [Rubripirellula tenax]|uniref:hypothetical protein n=1 Tax=Rubripirellula tenax TaxID=2528015 RepID=UPI00164940EB|nr:hypothetical protein [Rubripirellula tenax]
MMTIQNIVRILSDANEGDVLQNESTNTPAMTAAAKYISGCVWVDARKRDRQGTFATVESSTANNEDYSDNTGDVMGSKSP